MTYSYDANNHVMLPHPIREGYDFLDWYVYADFTGEPIETIAKGSYGDKTVYAKWIKVYELILKDGSTYEKRISLRDGETYNLPVKSEVVSNSSRDYYNGVWAGDVGTFGFGEGITFRESNGDLWDEEVLNVLWTGKQFSITYINTYNGRNYATVTAPSVFNYGTAIDFRNHSASFPSYGGVPILFEGFYRTSNFTNKLYI